MNGAPRDPVLEAALRQHGVDAVYILDRLAALRLPLGEQADLFYDHIHLQRAGRQIWAAIIATELRRVLGP